MAAFSSTRVQSSTLIRLVTRREDLRHRIERLAAAAGIAVENDTSVASLSSAGAGSALIVLDDTLLADLPYERDGFGSRRSDSAIIVVTTVELDAGAWRQAMSVGCAAVIRLPEGDRELIERMLAWLDSVSATANVLAVVGASGGLGVSTLSAALGLAAARTGVAALVDADSAGGGLEVLLGRERLSGATWADLEGIRGRIAPGPLLTRLVSMDDMFIVGFGATPSSVRSSDSMQRALRVVVDALIRGCGTVVIDAGRAHDPLSCLALAIAHQRILVVSATVHALAAADRLLHRMVRSEPQPTLVVAIPDGPHISTSQIEDFLFLPVTATLSRERRVARAAAMGLPPPYSGRGGLARACTQLLNACPGAATAVAA